MTEQPTFDVQPVPAGVPGKTSEPIGPEVIAGTDPVAVDSFGATLFGISGKDVPHVLYASQAGLGEIDLKKVRISRV